MHGALVSPLADHAHATNIVAGKRDASLLGNFSNGALMRTFTLTHFKLAANGTAHSNVGLLLAMQQQDAPLVVPDVA